MKQHWISLYHDYQWSFTTLLFEDIVSKYSKRCWNYCLINMRLEISHLRVRRTDYAIQNTDDQLWAELSSRSTSRQAFSNSRVIQEGTTLVNGWVLEKIRITSLTIIMPIVKYRPNQNADWCILLQDKIILRFICLLFDWYYDMAPRTHQTDDDAFARIQLLMTVPKRSRREHNEEEALWKMIPENSGFPG